MKFRKYEYWVGDFETTVYDGQTYTEVWASALVKLNDTKVAILHSIDDTFEFIKEQESNMIIYYHNLKFDGSFWLDFLINKLHFTQAYDTKNNTPYWIDDEEMPRNSFKYMISDMGQWYTITIHIGKYYIELRDSLKLLPFSLRKIGKSFKTKHQKLEMEYTGFRYAGCPITNEEKKYIANDVLVIKEALEIMFGQGHNKLTIGACCLSEYKNIVSPDFYDSMFPDLYEIQIDEDTYGSPNADAYIRNSYHGGWCYVVPEKANQMHYNGLTADVNSLYPSMMSSQSGNSYPVGKPTFFQGSIPPQCFNDGFYFFVRVRTRFKLKPDKLPCIQVKHNLLYSPTEWLTTSDIRDKKGVYHSHYYDTNGNLCDTRLTLTLTQTDYKLIQEHYDLTDFEILDGCYFYSQMGIFDDYIDKYKKIKQESTGAIRELAKLFLNNLYGKMASSKNSSFKIAMPDENGVLKYYEVPEFNKATGYIAVGSAITSYARNFTIRSAQKNYYGKHKRGFIYADTDSIHCDLKPEELVDIPVHPTDFCCWKLEGSWDYGLFVRQKTYIEHITQENLEPVDPYFNIKCAGLPDTCKQLFLYSLLHKTAEEWEQEKPEIWNKMNDTEKEFITHWNDVTDFKRGLLIPSKLMPRTIRGGVVLVSTTFEMR